jgi:hypothetical protein
MLNQTSPSLILFSHTLVDGLQVPLRIAGEPPWYVSTCHQCSCSFCPGGPAVPHLAVVAFTVIAIVLILIFVRFRFDQRLDRIVYLALDALICVFLIALIVICFRFSTS